MVALFNHTPIATARSCGRIGKELRTFVMAGIFPSKWSLMWDCFFHGSIFHDISHFGLGLWHRHPVFGQRYPSLHGSSARCHEAAASRRGAEKTHMHDRNHIYGCKGNIKWNNIMEHYALWLHNIMALLLEQYGNIKWNNTLHGRKQTHAVHCNLASSRIYAMPAKNQFVVGNSGHKWLNDASWFKSCGYTIDGSLDYDIGFIPILAIILMLDESDELPRMLKQNKQSNSSCLPFWLEAYLTDPQTHLTTMALVQAISGPDSCRGQFQTSGLAWEYM